MTPKAYLCLASCVLALSACDRGAPRAGHRAPVPSPLPSSMTSLEAADPGTPARETFGAFRWDAAHGVFKAHDGPLRAEKLWTFEGSTDGFVMANGDVAPSGSPGLTVNSWGADAILRSPSGLKVDGAARSLVLVRLTRLRKGSPWDGSVHYSTQSHRETGDYFAKLAMGSNPGVNETVTLVYDMRRLKRGGDDWKDSIIDQIRIDLDDGPGGAFLIRQIAIAHDPGGAVPVPVPVLAKP